MICKEGMSFSPSNVTITARITAQNIGTANSWLDISVKDVVLADPYGVLTMALPFV